MGSIGLHSFIMCILWIYHRDFFFLLWRKTSKDFDPILMHIFIQMVADLLVFNHGTLAEILKVRQWELCVYFSDLPLTRLIGSPGVKKNWLSVLYACYTYTKTKHVKTCRNCLACFLKCRCLQKEASRRELLLHRGRCRKCWSSICPTLLAILSCTHTHHRAHLKPDWWVMHCGCI